MIGAIVLAAGESRRMGAHKVLLPFGGTTVIGHIVDQLARSRVEQIRVIVGHEAARVIEALVGRPASIAVNADYLHGMLTSVRTGLRALPPECEIVVLALGDQPSITPQLVDRLIEAFEASDKGILVPSYDGRRGHPLLFSIRYRDEILGQFDTIGLRGLLQSHPEEILELAVPDESILSDMDYPEDYRRELARLKNS